MSVYWTFVKRPSLTYFSIIRRPAMMRLPRKSERPLFVHPLAPLLARLESSLESTYFSDSRLSLLLEPAHRVLSFRLSEGYNQLDP
jgi:hypothetical protein